MIRALYTAGSGMSAEQMNLDNIANNLANANTTGYKTQRVEFEDMLYQNARAPTSGTDVNGASRMRPAAGRLVATCAATPVPRLSGLAFIRSP